MVYQKENIKKIREWQRSNHYVKINNDLGYRLLKLLRGRLTSAVKRNGVKCAKTKELVGCTMEHLKKHLESLFTEGMNWDNQGIYGWHIDHKIPCANFDLTIPEQQKVCFHWTNLQPLWAIDNLKKGKKLNFTKN